MCPVARWPRAFQRSSTAACYLIALHKSSCSFLPALQSCHSTFLAICLLQRCSAVFGFAELVPLVLGSFCLGSKGKQLKNVERLVSGLISLWERVSFVGKITRFSFECKPNVFYLGYFCLKLQHLKQWLWIASLLQIPVVQHCRWSSGKTVEI